MIALDTNILIRFITKDDPRQAAQVERFLRVSKEEFFVGVPVVLELVWLLDRHFGYARGEIAQVLRAFYERKDFVFEDEAHVMAAVSAFEDGADFAGHIIVEGARSSVCSKLVTFDSDVIHRHPEFAIRPR
ncbi:MAG: type II toxin-antitoxin system VapC family toxin [Acidobacteria bacterium]|nr:type II toxin-antitoxin system VapC family toxin [Acidobacteriota bacterium]